MLRGTSRICHGDGSPSAEASCCGPGAPGPLLCQTAFPPLMRGGRSLTASPSQSAICVALAEARDDAISIAWRTVAGSLQTRHRNHCVAAAVPLVTHDVHGRPYMRGRPDRCVSLSRCAGIFAVALGSGPGLTVGVDLEQCHRIGRHHCDWIAYDNSELEHFHSPERAGPWYPLLWTAKEAAFKCLSGRHEVTRMSDVRVRRTCGGRFLIDRPVVGGGLWLAGPEYCLALAWACTARLV